RARADRRDRRAPGRRRDGGPHPHVTRGAVRRPRSPDARPGSHPAVVVRVRPGRARAAATRHRARRCRATQRGARRLTTPSGACHPSAMDAAADADIVGSRAESVAGTGRVWRDFHVRRTARERYEIDDALLGIRGDLAVADLAAIRIVAQRMNDARPAEAPGVTAGEIGALGLLHEIGHLLIARQASRGEPNMATAMRDVRRRLHDDLDHLLDRFGAAFPGTGPEPEPRPIQLEELLLTRVSNENPAIGPLRRRDRRARGGLRRGRAARHRRWDAGVARRTTAGAGPPGADIARRPAPL